MMVIMIMVNDMEDVDGDNADHAEDAGDDDPDHDNRDGDGHALLSTQLHHHAIPDKILARLAG